MDLKDVLTEIPGLNKRLVYYLESQGYIRPIHLPKERIARRDYAPEDLLRLKRFWTYYQRGFTVRGAMEAAERAERSTVLALLPVPPRERRNVLERLREFDRVLEAAVVYGENGDLIARLQAADERDAYVVLDRLFEVANISGAPRLWRLADGAAGKTSTKMNGHGAAETSTREGGMIAYVLIKAPPKQIGSVVEALRALPGVVEASALYGESDLIARLEVENQDELDDLVMNQIHSLPSVESTRTFIAVGGLRWERSPARLGRQQERG